MYKVYQAKFFKASNHDLKMFVFSIPGQNRKRDMILGGSGQIKNGSWSGIAKKSWESPDSPG
jgi:hypothetical protein